MVAPQDQQPDLNKLFPGMFQGPQTKGRPGTVEHQRDRMRQVAAAMRQDLSKLQYMLTGLNGDCGTIGTWDVARQLGTKVATAHRNMLATVQAYIQAYEIVIRRVETSAANYGKAEQAADTAARHPGQHLGQPPTTGPPSTLPWRTR
ncbi:hypothetical protein [Spirillospora sp. NPDC029432]|uniref:hypothetical protein n=1 Tax=Spirillospora sp. NPDC029432 TaxID=3154599 RepID=UPI003452ACCF